MGPGSPTKIIEKTLRIELSSSSTSGGVRAWRELVMEVRQGNFGSIDPAWICVVSTLYFRLLRADPNKRKIKMLLDKLVAFFRRRISKKTMTESNDAAGLGATVARSSGRKTMRQNDVKKNIGQSDSIFSGIDVQKAPEHIKGMLYVNKKGIEKNRRKVSLGNISIAKSGRFDVVAGDMKFECFGVVSKKNKLFVFLSGAGRKGNTSTRFDRLSWSGIFDGNCLYIEDPMYKLYPTIDVGWYYGTKEISFLDHCVAIISEFAENRSVRNEDIYIIGSSCAGYAAIVIASKIFGATAVALNPQIVPAIWDVNNRFEKSTGINLKGDDQFGRNDISHCFDNHNSRFIIVSNVLSQRDYVQQIKPVFARFGVGCHYGLNEFNNTYIVLASMLHPFDHGAFPGAMETNLLISILNNGGSNDAVVPFVEMLRSSFSSNTRLNYASLWANFLGKKFHDFVDAPDFCEKSNCVLKIPALPDFAYYQAHIDWTKTKCVVAFHLAGKGMQSVAKYEEMMDEICAISHAKIKIEKNRVVVYRGGLKYEDLSNEMFDFIDKTNKAVFARLIP